ncbi:MAG: hypothetical protein FJ104_07160, partial [Deltaproteobacteria bacterium]|nr:hypothetical protein [Deltaproteobacteria bacterium]
MTVSDPAARALAALAILARGGGTVVPLDPAEPDARLRVWLAVLGGALALRDGAPPPGATELGPIGPAAPGL